MLCVEQGLTSTARALKLTLDDEVKGATPQGIILGSKTRALMYQTYLIHSLRVCRIHNSLEFDRRYAKVEESCLEELRLC